MILINVFVSIWLVSCRPPASQLQGQSISIVFFCWIFYFPTGPGIENTFFMGPGAGPRAREKLNTSGAVLGASSNSYQDLALKQLVVCIRARRSKPKKTYIFVGGASVRSCSASLATSGVDRWALQAFAKHYALRLRPACETYVCAYLDWVGFLDPDHAHLSITCTWISRKVTEHHANLPFWRESGCVCACVISESWYLWNMGTCFQIPAP